MGRRRAIQSYFWDFGVGSTSANMKARHAYGMVGTYTVTLTVTVYSGNAGTNSAVVTVKERDLWERLM